MSSSSNPAPVWRRSPTNLNSEIKFAHNPATISSSDWKHRASRLLDHSMPFFCRVCVASFTLRGHSKSHLRVHTCSSVCNAIKAISFEATFQHSHRWAFVYYYYYLPSVRLFKRISWAEAFVLIVAAAWGPIFEESSEKVTVVRTTSGSSKSIRKHLTRVFSISEGQ